MKYMKMFYAIKLGTNFNGFFSALSVPILDGYDHMEGLLLTDGKQNAVDRTGYGRTSRKIYL